jgi:uncharacterized paraquat-inducible protein A
LIKRHLGFALNIAALGLFFPGILLPIFALNMEMAAVLSSTSLTSSLIDKELSIMATVQDLWADQRLLVAGLIFLFSVCIPIFKTTLVSIAYIKKNTQVEKRLLGLVSAIGKWSMADVFVVAVFLAILSTNHAETVNTMEMSLFGFKLGIDISSQTLSSVGQGFYYFTGYCFLSLFGTQLAMSALNDTPEDNHPITQ